MHLSIDGRKQKGGGVTQRWQGNAAFIYLPKSVEQLTTWPGYAFLGQTPHCECFWAVSHFQTCIQAYYTSLYWEANTCIPFTCSENIVRHYQSLIVTTALNQSQMDTQLSSSRAKQEAYWAELQRANESLWEDLPAGLKPTPLGTERSVVSSMPPNEMHRVIWLTICIPLQASRECAGDARPDMEMSCRSIFTAHRREA